MARTGPKKTVDLHLRAGEELGERFHALTKRMPLEVTQSDLVRRAVVAYLRIGERAPAHLQGDAVAAWIEGHVAIVLDIIDKGAVDAPGPIAPTITRAAPHVSRTSLKGHKR